MTGVNGELVRWEVLSQRSLHPQYCVGNRILSEIVADVLPKGAVLNYRPASGVDDLAQWAPESVEVQSHDAGAYREGRIRY